MGMGMHNIKSLHTLPICQNLHLFQHFVGLLVILSRNYGQLTRQVGQRPERWYTARKDDELIARGVIAARILGRDFGRDEK